ncbi:MAG: hypothetical protein GY743_23330 [Planctomycetaceae bacterium]|nr:hypothetical protein [Planctomycetaceae bacterium]
MTGLKWYQCFDCNVIDGEFEAFNDQDGECVFCGKEAKELSEDTIIYRAKTEIFDGLAHTLIIRKWSEKEFSVHSQARTENGSLVCESNLYTCQHWQTAVRYVYEGIHNLPNSIHIKPQSPKNSL